MIVDPVLNGEARVGGKIGLVIGHQDHVQGNGVDRNMVGTQKVEREALLDGRT